jgi:PsbP
MANYIVKPSGLRNLSDRATRKEHLARLKVPPVQATLRHHDTDYNVNSGELANSALEAIQRRSLLISIAATAAVGYLLAPAASVAVVAPPTLSQTFQSSEGFEFSYPDGFVVAYDRSGGRGDGAVAAVGDFTRFLVVSVLRTVDIPKDINLENGLTESVGHSLCIDPLLKDDSTQSFNELRSESNGEGRRSQYDYEYEIEVCRGEIQEGAGGVLRCLGGLGQEIPTQKRHHLARTVLNREGHLLTINAAAPVEKWAEVEDIMRGIVSSYRSV